MAGAVLGPGWYFSKQEIEENSPSRQDGIDANMEAEERRSFCEFQKELGMRLRISRKAIATATVLCHRFFLRQSLGRNDVKLIGTACVLLATKVEEECRRLKDVVLVSYEIIHGVYTVGEERRDRVFEREKDSVLMAERDVLETLSFDLNVDLPYIPLVAALRKVRVNYKNDIRQFALNFVNDGLRTSICVQFRPPHIVAGVIHLATMFLEVEVVPPHWWQWPEFDHVTMEQMNDICNQILEMYETEQCRIPRPRHDM